MEARWRWGQARPGPGQGALDAGLGAAGPSDFAAR